MYVYGWSGIHDSWMSGAVGLDCWGVSGAGLGAMPKAENLEIGFGEFSAEDSDDPGDSLSEDSLPLRDCLAAYSSQICRISLPISLESLEFPYRIF